MAKKPSVQEILISAEKAQADLAAQESALMQDVKNIDDIEWDRPLTKAERLQREKLRNAISNCRAAMLELSYVTLRALDKSDEVTRLVNSFKSINTGLEESLDRVKDIVSNTKIAAKSIGGVAKVAAKLAKYMA